MTSPCGDKWGGFDPASSDCTGLPFGNACLHAPCCALLAAALRDNDELRLIAEGLRMALVKAEEMYPHA